jgi:hypothetical protein
LHHQSQRIVTLVDFRRPSTAQQFFGFRRENFFGLEKILALKSKKKKRILWTRKVDQRFFGQNTLALYENNTPYYLSLVHVLQTEFRGVVLWHLFPEETSVFFG